MLSGQDFVIISSVEWNFLWQGPHEIATRLARAGNRVLYVENTGVRSPKWEDARRVSQRVTRWASAAARRGVRQIEPNLFVCSPLVMPPFGRPWQETLNRRVLLKAIVMAAASSACAIRFCGRFFPPTRQTILFASCEPSQSCPLLLRRGFHTTGIRSGAVAEERKSTDRNERPGVCARARTRRALLSRF